MDNPYDYHGVKFGRQLYGDTTPKKPSTFKKRLWDKIRDLNVGKKKDDSK